jgi:hypothetical protein
MSAAKGAASNLMEAMKQLGVEWDHARSSWRDVKAREFGEKYIEPLPNDLAKAKTVMEQIDELLKKVRSDCE